MNTKVANSYTFSRDFPDSAPRIRARDLAERIRAEPKAFAKVVTVRANDFSDSGETLSVIQQDGETWLTGAQCYALLCCLGHTKGLDKRLRKVSCEALLESIQAFVDERRNPGTQLSTIVGGKIAYERRMPGSADLFKEIDGEYASNEVGSIFILLRAARDPDPTQRLGVTVEAGLRYVREAFERGHAQLRRDNFSVVDGGKA